MNPTVSVPPSIELGFSEEERNEITTGLRRVLADTYTLYLKTHHYHWNVTGPMFQTLHTMFEDHYNDMWMAVDDVAERIRTLGKYSPGTYQEFSNDTSIASDTPGEVPAAEMMIANLVKGHETVAATIRPVLRTAADAGDEGTVDLLSGRLAFHEKTGWMLRSLLE